MSCKSFNYLIFKFKFKGDFVRFKEVFKEKKMKKKKFEGKNFGGNMEIIKVKYLSRFKYIKEKLEDCRENCERDIPEEYWCDNCKEVLRKFNNLCDKIREDFTEKYKTVLFEISSKLNKGKEE